MLSLLLLAGPLEADPPGAFAAVQVRPHVVARGYAVSIRAVRSREPLEALLDAYWKRFTEAGLYLPPRRDLTVLTQEPVLAALDPESLQAYSVLFQPSRDGTTTVIFTVTDLKHPVAATAGQELPLFPAARDVVRSVGEGLTTISFRADATEAEVRAFYAETLTRAGWQRNGDGDFAGPGGAQVRLSVSVAHGAGVISTLLVRTGEGAQPR